MITRDELTSVIETIIGHEVIATANRVDHRANGVQIRGKAEVNKICLGVTCNLAFLQAAIKANADYCVFHHGVDLDNNSIYNSKLNISQQQQLKYIFDNNLTIAGYHYSLDVQPKFGNSAHIIHALGATKLDIPYMSNWGWVGEYSVSQDITKIFEKSQKLFANNITAVFGGPKKVKRIGVATGGAKAVGVYLHEIADKGIDLHITGEINHTGLDMANECGFNYFAAGHYATEVFGVQELGKAIKKHFGDKLEVEFIDIPNSL